MSKDIIYREDAIKAINLQVRIPHDITSAHYANMARNAICSVPSADKPQGEWKPKNHHTDYCSNCGFEETQWRTADYNFCPSCGARMRPKLQGKHFDSIIIDECAMKGADDEKSY